MILPHPSEPAPTIALQCARASQIAYGPLDRMTGLTNLHPIVAGNDHGFVAWDERVVVVAIAGTDALDDWWFNGEAVIRTIGLVNCHRGFWRGACGLAREIERINPPEDRPWVITGHSRGGAIAQLLPVALDLDHECHVVTFGTPRCTRGNDGFSHYVRSMTSYVLPSDPVTLIPLWSRGWRDPGQRQYLFPDSVDDEWPWEVAVAAWNAAQFCLRWRTLGRSSAFGWAKAKHLCDRYVQRLEALAA